LTNVAYVANWYSNNVTVIQGARNMTVSSLVADVNPQYTGSSVTFTAYVAWAPDDTATPTGTVTFWDNVFSAGTSSVLGQVPLDGSGHAVYATSSLSAGLHTITAKYSGDPNFSPSTNSVAEQINSPLAPGPPNYNLSASPTTLVFQQGTPGTVTLSLAGINGYTGTVNFSCGTLPAGMACSFAPPSLAPKADGSALTSVLTVTFTERTAMVNQGGARTLIACCTFSFGAFGFVLVGGRNRRKPLLVMGSMILLLTLVLDMAACGSGSSSGNPPSGTYNVIVNAVPAAGGAPAQTLPLTITVTQ
jgi:hypothetical protein